MEQITRIGMDTSKHAFQLHGMNAAEEVILRKKLGTTKNPGALACDLIHSA